MYHFLVTFLVSDEKSTVILIIFPLQCHFFLAAFKIFPFSLSLAFKNLIMICVGLICGGCFVWGSLTLVRGFPGGSVVENLPASAVPALGRCPVGGNGNSSILAWKIPWTEEPCGLQSVGSHRVGHD